MSTTTMNSSKIASGFDRCCYQRHSCSRPRYLNYKYCAQHIVEDNQSPFTSCEYLSRTTGRKCPNPALRPRKQNSLPIFCSEHLHELIVKEKHQKQKRKLRRKRKSEKVSLEKSGSSKRQKLIEKLHKYCEGSSKSRVVQSHDTSTDSEVEEVHRPIKDDWLLENSASFDTDADWDDFDAVNNEVYEPLRYADVLTPEEVVATAQSKLIRLQSLYIEQFKRLFHLLKERRRQYLEDRKKEMKEEKAVAGMGRNVEFEENDEVYALATCGRRTGVEALLRKRQLQKREQAEGKVHGNLPVKSTTLQRCTHTSNHTRCKFLCLPYTKYCSSHILEDPHQLLYRKCHTTDCPMPVRHLTARSYFIPTDEGSDEEDVNYCIVHAPLLEMTFDFPAIVKSPEKMEVCDNLPEENSNELPPDTVPVGLTSNLDNLSPVNVDDEASNGPFDEAAVISNEVQQDREVVAQSASTSVLPSAGGARHEGSPVDSDENLTGANVRYAVEPEQTSQKYVDDRSPCATVPSAGDATSIDSEQKLYGDNVPEAAEPRPISREGVDAQSARATVPSVGDTIPESSHSAGNLTGDNVPNTVEPQPISHGCVDAKSPSATVLPREGDAIPESKPIDSEDNVTGRNLPNAIEPQSTSHECVDVQSSGATAAPIAGDATPKSSSIDSKENLTDENGPDAIKTQPTARGREISTATSSAVDIPFGDHVKKEATSDMSESCQKENFNGVEQVQNVTSLGTLTTDPHSNDQENISKPESGKRHSVESTQLCEMTGRLISDVIQAPSSVPNTTEASGDADIMPDCTNAGNGEEEHSKDHPELQKDPSQGTLTSPQPSGVPRYISERGERKPSSAEEEMAVVSLLQLCTGHASDDTTSSSAEQE